jgi:hypothetical protein
MKADYLRYIYECLSGDNGLLVGTDEILGQRVSFTDELSERNKNEISEEEAGHVDCDICNPSYDSNCQNPNFKPSHVYISDIEEKFISRSQLSLLEFVQHECNHEYEKAKRCMFDINKKVFDEKNYSA